MCRIVKNKLEELVKNKKLSEAEVLYFIVHLGKIIEETNIKDEYDLIKFYRNWCCYSCITKDTHNIFIRTKETIKDDEDNKIYNTDKKYEFIQEKVNFMEKIQVNIENELNKYSFDNLKLEIEKFCSEKLRNPIEFEWKVFFEKLSEIIIHTPLIIKNESNNLLKIELKKVSGLGIFDGIQVSIILENNNVASYGGKMDKIFGY